METFLNVSRVDFFILEIAFQLFFLFFLFISQMSKEVD